MKTISRGKWILAGALFFLVVPAAAQTASNTISLAVVAMPPVGSPAGGAVQCGVPITVGSLPSGVTASAMSATVSCTNVDANGTPFAPFTFTYPAGKTGLMVTFTSSNGGFSGSTTIDVTQANSQTQWVRTSQTNAQTLFSVTPMLCPSGTNCQAGGNFTVSLTNVPSNVQPSATSQKTANGGTAQFTFTFPNNQSLSPLNVTFHADDGSGHTANLVENIMLFAPAPIPINVTVPGAASNTFSVAVVAMPPVGSPAGGAVQCGVPITVGSLPSGVTASAMSATVSCTNVDANGTPFAPFTFTYPAGKTGLMVTFTSSNGGFSGSTTIDVTQANSQTQWVRISPANAQTNVSVTPMLCPSGTNCQAGGNFTVSLTNVPASVKPSATSLTTTNGGAASFSFTFPNKQGALNVTFHADDGHGHTADKVLDVTLFYTSPVAIDVNTSTPQTNNILVAALLPAVGSASPAPACSVAISYGALPSGVTSPNTTAFPICGGSNPSGIAGFTFSYPAGGTGLLVTFTAKQGSATGSLTIDVTKSNSQAQFIQMTGSPSVLKSIVLTASTPAIIPSTGTATSVTFTAKAVDGSGNPIAASGLKFTVTGAGAPALTAVAGQTGTYTASAAFAAGSYGIIATGGGVTSNGVTITVTKAAAPPPPAPTLKSIALTASTPATIPATGTTTSVTFTAKATDTSGNPIAASGLKFTATGTGAPALTAVAGQTGTYTASAAFAAGTYGITAAGGGITSNSVSITVTKAAAPPPAPTLKSIALTASTPALIPSNGTTTSVTFTAKATDTSGNPIAVSGLKFTATGTGAPALTASAGQTGTYTASASFAPGTYSVSVTGGGVTSNSVSVTVAKASSSGSGGSGSGSTGSTGSGGSGETWSCSSSGSQNSICIRHHHRLELSHILRSTLKIMVKNPSRQPVAGAVVKLTDTGNGELSATVVKTDGDGDKDVTFSTNRAGTGFIKACTQDKAGNFTVCADATIIVTQ